jgi:23S rRNA (uridine2552-2'-O)-methyltransferase
VRLLAADLLESGPELAADLGPFDLVVSDMAPRTTGRREVDQARSLALAERAWEWAGTLLRPGGDFLFKIFESPEADALARIVSGSFGALSRLKPKAVRSRSVEIYVLGLGFFGPDGTNGSRGGRFWREIGRDSGAVSGGGGGIVKKTLY